MLNNGSSQLILFASHIDVTTKSTIAGSFSSSSSFKPNASVDRANLKFLFNSFVFDFFTLEMWKLSNQLLLVSLVFFISIAASPIDFLFSDSEDNSRSELRASDLRYDQRQNGTENIRLRVDGVLIALPSSVAQSGAISGGTAALASEYLLQLAGATIDDDSNDHDDDDENDVADNIAEEKNAQKKDDKKIEASTQAEEKTPAEAQVAIKNVELRSNSHIQAEKDGDEPAKVPLKRRNK